MTKLHLHATRTEKPHWFHPFYFRDGLLSNQVHLTRQGYELWGAQMAPLLTELMQDPGNP